MATDVANLTEDQLEVSIRPSSARRPRFRFPITLQRRIRSISTANRPPTPVG